MGERYRPMPVTTMSARLAVSALLALAATPACSAPTPFYTQSLLADGIPIIASARVPPRALAVARDLVVQMLAHRPDLAQALVRRGQRVAIMAEGEATTDLPEQRAWTRPARTDPRLTICERKHYGERIGRLTDRQYWDARARGMAGVFTSSAAEDLLGLPTSRYRGETIFVHEFAHDILAAARGVDPALAARVNRAYAEAIAAGRWKGEYASTNVDEYWAVGTQFWFNSNKVATFDGRVVLSDADLAAYDPPLAAVLREVYGDAHHLAADPNYLSPARVPPGPLPTSTAEVC